ncbi:hypothetical protein Niako_4563 [Niastella koreensis GR20-10]|uniref:Uncharacterized protein n=1 Tax=Niastella koreensis (strain DSM 17620 / KACC 11465 / NBRC 106392 / GR20-10) TaxID=700598 RepID=G8TKY2_NIAKG|nr:hypothetical protein Niako_4563 [Niastella koreensis GR20-10]
MLNIECPIWNVEVKKKPLHYAEANYINVLTCQLYSISTLSNYHIS